MKMKTPTQSPQPPQRTREDTVSMKNRATNGTLKSSLKLKQESRAKDLTEFWKIKFRKSPKKYSKRESISQWEHQRKLSYIQITSSREIEEWNLKYIFS